MEENHWLDFPWSRFWRLCTGYIQKCASTSFECSIFFKLELHPVLRGKYSLKVTNSPKLLMTPRLFSQHAPGAGLHYMRVVIFEGVFQIKFPAAKPSTVDDCLRLKSRLTTEALHSSAVCELEGGHTSPRFSHDTLMFCLRQTNKSLRISGFLSAQDSRILLTAWLI